MRSKETRTTISRLQDFLDKQNPRMNDLLYSLMQVTLGTMKRETNECGNEVYGISDDISREDASKYLNSRHKAEFVKAFNETHKAQLDNGLDDGTQAWNQEAYEKYKKQFKK